MISRGKRVKWGVGVFMVKVITFSPQAFLQVTIHSADFTELFRWGITEREESESPLSKCKLVGG